MCPGTFVKISVPEVWKTPGGLPLYQANVTHDSDANSKLPLLLNHHLGEKVFAKIYLTKNC
jgi:hypothetical protein